MARISNLSLAPSEVDSIMLDLFGKQEGGTTSEATATKPAQPVQFIQQPTGLPMQLRTSLSLRQNPLVAVAWKPSVAPPVTVRPEGQPLLKPVVAAKKSAVGPVVAGATAGLLFGGPIGAAIGAGAGFALSKLTK